MAIMARRVLSLPEKIERFQAKLMADPHSLVFAQLADAYRGQGRLEEAILICQEGLSDCANYVSAYMVLGRAYKEKGDLLQAREAFQRVLHLDPESVSAHKFLGEIAEARGEMPEAVAAYRMALILHPFDKELRATAEHLEGRAVAGAESAAPAVAEAHPKPPVPQPASATTPVEAAVPEAPAVGPEASQPETEPLATETLAGLYAAQGFYQRAADIYARLVAEAPDRDDLAQKYRAILSHVEKGRAAAPPASPATVDVLHRLEAWRKTFQKLKRKKRRGRIELLEAWRCAFEGLRERPRGPIGLLQAWRDVFRKLRAAD